MMRGRQWFLVLFFSVFSLVCCTSAKPLFGAKIMASNDTLKRFPRFSDIIFPEDDMSSEELPQLEGPPSCANDSTFCEHFSEYPQNYLKIVLKENSVNKALFGMDIVPEFGTRDGNADIFVCKSRVRTIFPKVGKNTRNDWKVIINQGKEEGYIQGVVIETCIGKGSQCDIIGNMVSDYTTSCKQKYIYRRLLSLDRHGKPVQDTFMLPSACCCTYKRNYDFLSGYFKRK